MADRYFSAEPILADSVVLDDAEGHHLARVMRAQPGDEVTLFDGQGAEFSARVTSVKKDRVELTIIERREIDRESPTRLTLAVALPKGDRQKWLVEKAVELGVARVVPMVTMRGVSQPVDAALVRLRRAVIEASKQCGRNRLMEIAEPADWNEFAVAVPREVARFIAHPGEPANERDGAASEIVAAIGPEGGFTEQEVELARAAEWKTLPLGPRILRVETAALACAARWLIP